MHRALTCNILLRARGVGEESVSEQATPYKEKRTNVQDWFYTGARVSRGGHWIENTPITTAYSTYGGLPFGICIAPHCSG